MEVGTDKQVGADDGYDADPLQTGHVDEGLEVVAEVGIALLEVGNEGVEGVLGVLGHGGWWELEN